MTSLPSFVELMASLGLDQAAKASDHTTNSSLPPPSPGVSVPLHTRPRSSPSLRELKPTNQRVSRYAPYSPVISSNRRGSLSSISSSSSYGESPLRSHSSSPRPSSRLAKHSNSMNNLSIHVYDSTPDLGVNTPISSYLRRRTPGLSPTSPSFPPERRCKSRSASPLAFTVPTLPTLYHHSPSSSSSSTLSSDSENDMSLIVPRENSRVSTERRRRPRAGTRISYPTRSKDVHKNLLRSRSYAQLA